MVADPLPTAVTRPLLFTVATLVLLLLQDTLWPLGDVVARSVVSSPAIKVSLEEDMLTLTSRTATEQLSE